MNEQEQFLQDTNIDPNKIDVLDQPLFPVEDPEKGENSGDDAGDEHGDDDGKGELKPRNRRERRLMDKLAAERESSSFLAGKLEARTEADRDVSSEEADYLKMAERIYGNETPEAQIATDLLKKAILGARDDAKKQAIEEMRSERTRETTEENDANRELDNIIDEIEDEYEVELTPAQETAYFTLLEKMSPKRDGIVIEYADPHAVWEVFSERLKKPADTRAKDLSSRSMVNSGSSKENNLSDDVAARFLKEQGII